MRLNKQVPIEYRLKEVRQFNFKFKYFSVS